MTFSKTKLSSVLLLATLALVCGCQPQQPSGEQDCDEAQVCEEAIEEVAASVDYSMAEPGEVAVIKNDVEFANFIKNNEIAVVKFGAEWCGPCKALDPEFDKMAGYFQVSGLAFARVDVDQVPTVPHQFGVSGIPDTYIFYNGQPYTHVVGNVPASVANAINSVCQQTVSVEEAQSELQKDENLEKELWGDEQSAAPEDATTEAAEPAAEQSNEEATPNE